MKVIKIFATRADAEMAKGFLENSNIHTMISADDEGGLHPALGSQMGTRLSVADDDVEAALKIITQLEQAAPLKEGE